MNMVYGIGASIVIIGALFKILHWDFTIPGVGWKFGGGTLLAIGLITEAIIFFISAFEPVHEEYDWSLVYPELVGGTPKATATNREDLNLSAAKEVLDQHNKELAQAVGHLLALNKSFVSQLEEAKTQVGTQKEVVESLNALSTQTKSFKQNIEALNGVYGGMLSAMKGNK